jgi:hypothetical protein
MKKVLCSVAVLLVLSAVPYSMFAATVNPPLSKERQELIKTNLLVGLNHSSTEVQADYMQLVIDLKRAYPEYDFDYAIIPLMNKLKNCDDCPVRILAALALYEFQDSRKSRFAVQQTIEHCDTPRLARFCQTLIRKWDNRAPRPNYVAEVVYPF